MFYLLPNLHAIHINLIIFYWIISNIFIQQSIASIIFLNTIFVINSLTLFRFCLFRSYSNVGNCANSP